MHELGWLKMKDDDVLALFRRAATGRSRKHLTKAEISALLKLDYGEDTKKDDLKDWLIDAIENLQRLGAGAAVPQLLRQRREQRKRRTERAADTRCAETRPAASPGRQRPEPQQSYSRAFLEESSRRLHAWQVDRYAQNQYLHNITAALLDEQRHRIREELERQWGRHLCYEADAPAEHSWGPGRVLGHARVIVVD